VAGAGYGRLSLSSVLAGVLVGAGCFGILAVSAVAIAQRAGWKGQFTDTPPGELALGGGLVAAGLLLVSFVYGGYVAGRMARRSGVVHGVATFVLAVAGAAGAAAIVAGLNNVDLVARTLHKIDLPVTRNDWRSNTGVTIGIACAAAMFVGSLFGAIRGDRWHGRLAMRAAPVEVEDVEGVEEPAVVDRDADFEQAVRDGRHVAGGDRQVSARGDRQVSLEEERELARGKG
jgi:hypothetical protein